jgi:DedD protein
MPEAEDAQLLIKKRARRRLVGAVALSLFAAIVFPLAMDRDPGPLVQDIEIRIPGQEDRALSNRLALQPPAETAATPQDTPAATPSAAATPVAETTPPATEPTQEKAPAPVVKVVETKHSTDEKQLPKTADKSSEKSGQFVILIGAFSNEGNIKNLRNKLSEAGIKSYTEPLGDKTRVRAGPFNSRESAEKALQKMKGMSVNGQISSK